MRFTLEAKNLSAEVNDKGLKFEATGESTKVEIDATWPELYDAWLKTSGRIPSKVAAPTRPESGSEVV